MYASRVVRRITSLAVLFVALLASGTAAAQQPPTGTPEPQPEPQQPIPPLPDEGAGEAGENGSGEAGEAGENGENGENGEQPTGDQPVEPALQVIVVDAAPYGIDPVVGRHVTDQMRATASAMGYRVLEPAATVAAAQQLRMPYPPTPADLWRVTHISRSHRGAFARVWAHDGAYVIEITIASADGAGPFFARGTSGASDLHGVVDRLMHQALPPPSTWQEGQTPGQAIGAPSGPGGTTQLDAIHEVEERERIEQQRERRRQRERERQRRMALRYRWHVVLQTEGAIGTSQDGFYNHLVGLRLDYRITPDIAMGIWLGYANLNGKDGRVDNVLAYLLVEDRIRISSSSDISIPLRAAIGYLPYNGPVIRLAAGLNIPLSERFELGFDILTPTFWILPDRTAVSLNVAAELVLRI